jgi:hypothetical protein
VFVGSDVYVGNGVYVDWIAIVACGALVGGWVGSGVFVLTITLSGVT